MSTSCLKLFVLASVVLFLSGCAATTPKSVSHERYLWPLPPEKPRIEYITIYDTEDDVVSGKKQGALSEALVGKNETPLFYLPAGVAVRHDGQRIYGSLPNMSRVQVLDLEAGTVKVLGEPGDINRPMGLWVDSRGTVYVADNGLGKVARFDANHNKLAPIAHENLKYPAYVAVNERLGRIYISDSKLHKVVVFDMDGTFLFEFGERGAATGRFFVPQGIAIAPDDRVYVCDLLNARVQVFDPDGNYLNNFGERGDGLGYFDHPKSAAFDSDGNLYVVDTRLARFQVMTPDGDLLLIVGAGGKSLHAMGFVNPVQVFITPDNGIYIIDNLANRISVWQYLDEAYLADNPVTEEQKRWIEEQRKARAGSPVPKAK